MEAKKELKEILTLGERVIVVVGDGEFLLGEFKDIDDNGSLILENPERLKTWPDRTLSPFETERFITLSRWSDIIPSGNNGIYFLKLETSHESKVVKISVIK